LRDSLDEQQAFVREFDAFSLADPKQQLGRGMRRFTALIYGQPGEGARRVAW
jgi:hypothetical protein